MGYKITTEESIILRDGRPFGDVGIFSGNSLQWPYPQTITGMLRNAIGLERDPDYFKDPKNCKDIFAIGIQQLFPLLKMQATWQFLLPPPADMVLTQDKAMHPLIFKPILDNEGTDIENREWLLATINLTGKPAKERPFFWYLAYYEKYLQGTLTDTHYSPSEIGINAPIQDMRIHNAISDETLTTEESRLFANHGFYFKTKNEGEIQDLALYFKPLGGVQELTRINDLYLGGERRRVHLSESTLQFPNCPDYRSQAYLKIILTTHGDFGGWCPNWLTPNLSATTITWVTLPKSDYKIRLRSAVISGWDPVSGWDYKTCQAKAMKKLVRSGSVYIIELRNAEEAQAIAEYFWLKNLDPENQEALKNGYGQCLVGRVNINKD